MIIEKFAPILIPTLNRHDHLKRCLDSLVQNSHASKTHLYIALDAPLHERHKEGYQKIVEYLGSEIHGFKNLTVIKREKNLGPIWNTLNALRELLDQEGMVILTEDDNFFSPNFLDYMNKGLQTFKDRPDIFGVCAYSPPIHMPPSYKDNFYLWKGFEGWGCGFWNDKYKAVELSANWAKKCLQNIKNVLKLNKEANYLIPKLLDIIEKNYVTGDTIFSANMVKNDMFCVFPTLSKARNYGVDGTGAHSHKDKNNVFANQSIDNEKYFDFSNSEKVKENGEINKALLQYLRVSQMEVLKRGILHFVKNRPVYNYYKKAKQFFK